MLLAVCRYAKTWTCNAQQQHYQQQQQQDYILTQQLLV
jgi:hypothetical protein